MKILLFCLIIEGYNTNNCKAENPNIMQSVNTTSNNSQINASKVANSTQPQIQDYNDELVTSLMNLYQATKNARNMINKMFGYNIRIFSENTKKIIQTTLAYQFDMLEYLAQTLQDIALQDSCNDINDQKMMIINIIQEYKKWVDDVNNVRFKVEFNNEFNNNEIDDLKNQCSELLHIYCNIYCKGLYDEINNIKRLLGI